MNGTKQKETQISRKQELYQEMIRDGLILIRNIQRSASWRHKAFGKTSYYEAELLHNLHHVLYEPEFTDHDIWFLNAQAREYLEKTGPKRVGNHIANKERIKELLGLVPQEKRAQIDWESFDRLGLKQA